MPTYEYECGACAHQFEATQKITEDSLVDCPACGKPDLRRLISATAFHLKGSGWYKTDYASGSDSGAPAKKTASSSDSDSSSKSASSDTSSSSAESSSSDKSASKSTDSSSSASSTKSPAKKTA